MSWPTCSEHDTPFQFVVVFVQCNFRNDMYGAMVWQWEIR
ncbi:hypothetical protein DM40_1553 [Burkholderia cenocepacia]|nr:hypothetical protein DM40_1553 [Burkholderia cenocepacia]